MFYSDFFIYLYHYFSVAQFIRPKGSALIYQLIIIQSYIEFMNKLNQ